MTSAYVSTQYRLTNMFVLIRRTGQHSQRMCTENKTVKDSIFFDFSSVASHPRRTDVRSLEFDRILKTEYHMGNHFRLDTPIVRGQNKINK